jgi:regulator of protease activity HflC (stomatin/prohibitin superfamily)
MNKLKKTGIVSSIVLVVIFLMNPFVIINAGYRGVMLTWGKVTDVLSEGFHIRIPIAQKVQKIETRIVKLETKSVAYSKDIQTADSVVALNYHVDPPSVGNLYKDIGMDYVERIISPSIQESVKATTAKFTAQELIEKREMVRDEIRTILIERLSKNYLIVDAFSIVDFDFSDNYEKAIEEKQVAQQMALKAENDLRRVKLEAEQRIAQAKGEAEAIRIQVEAITQQGGKDYVSLKTVEKWDGKLPINLYGAAPIPFLNIHQ